MATPLSRHRTPPPSAPSAPAAAAPALHDRAIQDLSFIRRTMEGSASFTDVPGYGLVAIGCTAIAAAPLAASQSSAGRWLTVWLFEALVGATIGSVAIWRKIRARPRAAGAPMLTTPARKFFFGFWPAMLAGAALTFALIDFATIWQPGSAAPRVLPALWLLLYGVGITTAGAFSVRAVPLMGIGFMALGITTLILPPSFGTLMLALGFGAWQIAIGAWIARRHGG